MTLALKISGINKSFEEEAAADKDTGTDEE
jgi:hypothetical protein